MYLHRPDILSFAFGLLFTLIGLSVLLLGLDVTRLEPDVVLGLLALTAGVGVAGSLLFGDVHRTAAERMAQRTETSAAGQPDVASFGQAPPLEESLIDETLFGPPLDPEELDRAYRETFGDDDPDLGPRS